MRAILGCWLSFIAASVLAQEKSVPADMQLHFATKAEATQTLSIEDDFVQRLSPFDRSSRLKTDQEVDKDTYIKFVAEQALDWTDGEKEVLQSAWQRVIAGLAEAKFQAPAKVTLIKTTGLEEGDAAYTRGTSIILPKSKASGRNLDMLLAHELFHVLSRHDAGLRERLYSIIGFRKCGELELPVDLQSRKITNPDAPVCDNCIQIKHDDKPLWVIPVLLSKSEKYDKQRGGEFFNYLQFSLMAIESPDSTPTRPLLVEGKPVLIDARMAPDYLEQIGKNTGYIIHPDEIMADNFSFWIGKRTVAQPDLVKKVERAIKGL